MLLIAALLVLGVAAKRHRPAPGAPIFSEWPPLGPRGSAETSFFDASACDFSRAPLERLKKKARHRVVAVARMVEEASSRNDSNMLVETDLKGLGGAPAKTLLYLATHGRACHLVHLQSCWPGTLRRAPPLAAADVLLFAGIGRVQYVGERALDVDAPDASLWLDALARFPNRNVSVAWQGLNPGYQAGALAAMTLAAQSGWFGAYKWIIRANPDISIVDALPLERRLAQPNTSAVLFVCPMPNGKRLMVNTDFFAARPDAMDAKFWASHRHQHAEQRALAVFRTVIAAGRAVIWHKDSEDVQTGDACRVNSWGIAHNHRHCTRARELSTRQRLPRRGSRRRRPGSRAS